MTRVSICVCVWSVPCVRACLCANRRVYQHARLYALCQRHVLPLLVVRYSRMHNPTSPLALSPFVFFRLSLTPPSSLPPYLLASLAYRHALVTLVHLGGHALLHTCDMLFTPSLMCLLAFVSWCAWFQRMLCVCVCVCVRACVCVCKGSFITSASRWAFWMFGSMFGAGVLVPLIGVCSNPQYSIAKLDGKSTVRATR
jgi:hypothetical protein